RQVLVERFTERERDQRAHDVQVLTLAVTNDHPYAQALLIPDTAMHTLEVLPKLEAALGKPVLTANQVTIWEGLRLAGVTAVAPELGALFAEGSRHVDH
ncbi:hypothetical protein ACFWF3_28185, partial [Nocardia sp. NPDC060220]